MKTNYVIAGLVLVALGVGLFFIGERGLFGIEACSGWDMIKPWCWAGLAIDVAFKLVMIAAMVIMVLAGIVLMLLEDQSQLKYYGAFVVLMILTAASWLTPMDPIPFLDEILLPIATGWLGIKAISPDAEVKKLAF